ncbi:transketolase [Pelagibacteraceae bacterium]|nr:transketolase [Pelagibacteraceae bacterium]
MNIKKTEEFSKQIRKNIILAAFSAGAKSAHIGGALSIADIISVLFGDIMNLDSKNPLNIDRDRFILSKGHACLALYSVLAEKNFIKTEDLKNFGKSNSNFLGHPTMDKKKGIEFSTGSLGMGLSLGVGVAYAGVKKKKKYKVFIVLGDGECNEGSVWESVLLASHLKLDNLVVFIDKNNLQQTGKNQDILNLGDLTKKFLSFNWNAIEINGHDHSEIYQAVKNKKLEKPLAVIANTTKGKGVSIFENNNEWHHSILSETNYEQALKELDKINS